MKAYSWVRMGSAGRQCSQFPEEASMRGYSWVHMELVGRDCSRFHEGVESLKEQSCIPASLTILQTIGPE